MMLKQKIKMKKFIFVLFIFSLFLILPWLLHGNDVPVHDTNSTESSICLHNIDLAIEIAKKYITESVGDMDFSKTEIIVTTMPVFNDNTGYWVILFADDEGTIVIIMDCGGSVINSRSSRCGAESLC